MRIILREMRHGAVGRAIRTESTQGRMEERGGKGNEEGEEGEGGEAERVWVL